LNGRREEEREGKGREGKRRAKTYKKYPAAHNPPATMIDRG
jgi:hypothetical protein